jgi:hypothetical protein
VTTPSGSVRLRCGHCNRLLDRAEERLSGWVLAGRERAMIPARVTAGQAAYRCKCGPEPGREIQVSMARVAELAPRAAELGVDLLAGLPRYGLPSW